MAIKPAHAQVAAALEMNRYASFVSVSGVAQVRHTTVTSDSIVFLRFRAPLSEVQLKQISILEGKTKGNNLAISDI